MRTISVFTFLAYICLLFSGASASLYMENFRDCMVKMQPSHSYREIPSYRDKFNSPYPNLSIGSCSEVCRNRYFIPRLYKFCISACDLNRVTF